MEFRDKVLRGMTYPGYLLIALFVFFCLPGVIAIYFMHKSDNVPDLLPRCAIAATMVALTLGWMLMFIDFVADLVM